MLLKRHSTLLRILFFLFLLLILLFATGVLRAQIHTAADDDVNAEGPLQDIAFFAAGNLNLSVKSLDDVFAAGGDIAIDGAQADRMHLAGGDITMMNVAFHDVVAVGGDLNFITGTVTDDVVAAGGDLTLAQGFSVGGSAVLAGGDVVIETPVGGELRVAAGRLTLSADVAQDARLVGDTVRIGPNVAIGGDLSHRAKIFEMDPSATVEGEIIELEPVEGPDMERWSIQAAATLAAFFFALLIGIALLVIVIALALPGLMNSASAMIREKPLSTLGVGFLITAAAPVVVAILFATLIGAPLALMIAAIYIAVAPLAIAVAIYFIAMEGRQLFSKSAEAPGPAARAVWTLLGGALFVVLGLIPVLGGLVWLVAYIFGVGAVMTRGGKALAGMESAQPA